MIKPLENRILVKTVDYEKKTKSGIILNDSSTQNELLKAKVVEVSEDVNKLKINDIIYFSKYKGESIKYEDEDYIILDTKDVLAKEIM